MMDKAILKNQYKRLAELKEIEERIKEMEATIEGIGTQVLTDEPKGSEKPKQEDKIIKLADEKQNYEELKIEFEKEQYMIEQEIRVLEDPLERAVMRYRYIRMMSWDDAADAMGYSERHTKRIHGEALQKLLH